MFDDDTNRNHAFVLLVAETNGQLSLSAPLDAGKGGYEVDGFLGAISQNSTLDWIAVGVLDGNSLRLRRVAFEMDHLQFIAY